jgi:serine/threonine-protein kinase
MIGSARGDDHATTTAADAFCTAAAQPCTQTDATLGRASILIGCSHLLPLLPPGPAAATVEHLGTATQAGLTLFDAPASDHRWLGIAHGQAGMLYASLLWADATGTPPDEQMERALNTLAALATPAGRGLHWPIKTGDPSRPPATGWCHGSAGWVHLWNLADTVLPGRSYGPLAESAAWHTWQTPSHTGGSLCCGYAGQAYALLAQHRRTDDPAWLTRAAALARRAADPRTRGLRPGSLYAGDVGVALLTAELQRPDLARMPAFEPEARRSAW